MAMVVSHRVLHVPVVAPLVRHKRLALQSPDDVHALFRPPLPAGMHCLPLLPGMHAWLAGQPLLVTKLQLSGAKHAPRL